jgi:hypothetical protein
MASLAAAQAQGRTGGRPAAMGAGKLAAASARRARGESAAKIARPPASAAAPIYRHLALKASKASPQGPQRAPATMVYTAD